MKDSRDGRGAPRVTVTNRRRRGWFVALLQGALLALVPLGLAAALAVLALYASVARTLPPVPPFESLREGGFTVVTANDGLVVGEFFAERRLELDFDDIPAGLILALLAAEDERFFEHSGLDLRGVARAAVSNLRAGRVVEGASTLTQQLAKSVLGRGEDFGKDAVVSLRQKAREAIYARRLEDTYTKEQILLLYLNRIYLGHGSYGVRAAAQNYFRKDLRELELTEMALLAGLPQAPSALDPLRHPERARARLVHVLGQMERNGFVTAEERAAAAAAPLVVYPLSNAFKNGAPYFVQRVVRELKRRFARPDAPGAWRERGLRVETTVDIARQRAAAETLDEGLRALDRKQGYRGPLVHLEEADRPRFLARVAAELRGQAPAVGTRWPALVERVDADGVDARLTEALAGRLPLESMRWAGRYEEKPKVSFGRKLKDPRKVFRPGDVVLVRVEAREAGGLALALDQDPQVEGALVALDPFTGNVSALQGGFDHDRSEVNRVFAVRQTGSAIKPFVYGLAYDLGLAPSTLLSGAPFREGDYAPTRGKGKDDLIVWDALAKSENNISLRVMNYVQQHGGVERLRAWLGALGLTRPVQGYTAEVLGVDQTPLGMTRAMATVRAGGRRVEPTLIRRIEDREGRVLQRPAAFHDPMNAPLDVLDALDRWATRPPERAIPRATAYLMGANLREVFRRGTARKEGRSLRAPAAGKTGTLPYDVWFTGFTADTAATVWIGADRRERILGAGRRRSRVYGANTALPVWRDFLNATLTERSKREPLGPAPYDVVTVRIDPETGLRAREGGRAVPHRVGTEPVGVAPAAGGSDDAAILQTEF